MRANTGMSFFVFHEFDLNLSLVRMCCCMVGLKHRACPVDPDNAPAGGQGGDQDELDLDVQRLRAQKQALLHRLFPSVLLLAPRRSAVFDARLGLCASSCSSSSSSAPASLASLSHGWLFGAGMCGCRLQELQAENERLKTQSWSPEIR